MIIITIPVYNDGKILKETLNTVVGHIKEDADDHIILIADDGSTDETNQIVKNIMDKTSKEIPEVKYVRLLRNSGRGKVLTTAWSKVKGDIYIYLDSDMATDITYLNRLIEEVRSGYDLVTGSRYLPSSQTIRPPLRKFVSMTYNFLISLMFRDGVRDHQCGFKAFSHRMISTQLSNCRDERWFWDTEMIVLARLAGYPIKEIPVKWREKRGEKTPIKRLLKDVYLLGKGMLRLWWRVYSNPKLLRRLIHITY